MACLELYLHPHGHTRNSFHEGHDMAQSVTDKVSITMVMPVRLCMGLVAAFCTYDSPNCPMSVSIMTRHRDAGYVSDSQGPSCVKS